MLIGVIADDFTGATDLALMLARGGMRTVQVIGVPGAPLDLPDADAVVVALKSRTIPAADAVRMSLAAADALLAAGAEQIFFKYCSTFDSTDAGNIGPVAEALADRLGARMVVACPAFPANGRTVYRGHLFVGDQLLSESSMRDHPLTPMRDSNLVRVLGRQVTGKVGLVARESVAAGPEAIGARLSAIEADGGRFAILDAISNADLHAIGAAIGDLPLVTGGSGIALGLPDHWRRKGRLAAVPQSAELPPVAGRGVFLAGSCSQATRRQVARAEADGIASRRIDPISVAAGETTAEEIVAWVEAQTGDRPALIYSSADPADVAAAQDRLGREAAGAVIERLLGAVASSLASRGFTRFIVAGGETSGAVVEALRVRSLQIGPEIDPGIPWTATLDAEPRLALALKSGNFGSEDFFLKAWSMLK